MSDPSTLKPQGPLFQFESDRDSITSAVVERSVSDLVTRASRGGAASLEFVLNEAAHHEIRRLESGSASKRERSSADAWRDLARSLGHMSDDEKVKRTRALVEEFTEDISGRFDPRIHHLASRFVPWALSILLAPHDVKRVVEGPEPLWERLTIEGPFDLIRHCGRRGTLVFVPTHSSNLDSGVLGWALHVRRLPAVSYGAGKNLFGNKILGFFLRNLGAYRVDRRLNFSLYKDALKRYSTELLLRGYHQLFFPGGTRCRTGIIEDKLKLGLLGCMHTAYQENLIAGRTDRRFYVVPVTMNYGITLEAESLVNDALAEQGRQSYIIDDDESARFGSLFDFVRRIIPMDSAIVLRFGRPLDLLGHPVDDEGESLAAGGQRVDPARYFQDWSGRVQADDQRDAEYTRQLGARLVREYKDLAVMLPTHIVARALFDRVATRAHRADVIELIRTHEGTSIPYGELLNEVIPWVRMLHEQNRMKGPTDPHAVIDAALRAFGAFHSRPAARRIHDDVRVDHLRLLFFYRNRTIHLEPPAVGGALP